MVQIWLICPSSSFPQWQPPFFFPSFFFLPSCLPSFPPLLRFLPSVFLPFLPSFTLSFAIIVFYLDDKENKLFREIFKFNLPLPIW